MSVGVVVIIFVGVGVWVGMSIRIVAILSDQVADDSAEV